MMIFWLVLSSHLQSPRLIGQPEESFDLCNICYRYILPEETYHIFPCAHIVHKKCCTNDSVCPSCPRLPKSKSSLSTLQKYDEEFDRDSVFHTKGENEVKHQKTPMYKLLLRQAGSAIIFSILLLLIILILNLN